MPAALKLLSNSHGFVELHRVADPRNNRRHNLSGFVALGNNRQDSQPSSKIENLFGRLSLPRSMSRPIRPSFRAGSCSWMANLKRGYSILRHDTKTLPMQLPSLQVTSHCLASCETNYISYFVLIAVWTEVVDLCVRLQSNDHDGIQS
jgi:hypothetical protein